MKYVPPWGPRALVAIALACASGAHPASADIYSLTFDRALPAPAANCFAIGVDEDGTLWAHSQFEKRVYRLDPVNGSVLQSFSSGNPAVISDLDVHGGILYANAIGAILRFKVSTGLPLPSLVQPITGGERGLAFVSDRLYTSGVFAGYPGEVRFGEVDPATGALLQIGPVIDTDSDDLGAIGPYVCFTLPVENPQGPLDPIDIVLHVADPATGAAVQDISLFKLPFATPPDYTLVDTSSEELFVSRRDLGQIWVYRFTTPVPVTQGTWGRIKAEYRQ